MSQLSDFQYFKDNLESLYSEYGNCHLLIKDGRVVFASKDILDVMDFAEENGLERGSYIIQRCGATPECYTATYHSAVVSV